jgi:hypothetical protein
MRSATVWAGCSTGGNVAKVLCFQCRGECKYNIDTGYWICSNGHGQRLDLIIAGRDDLVVGRCPRCECTKELVKFPFEKTGG